MTPVKYSAVAFAANLIFNLLLMHWFGHIGIAMATTIAAFVSLTQYICGLKKRGYWQFTKPLLIQMLKIAFISVFTGALVYALSYIFAANYGELLRHKLWLLAELSFLGAFALAIFMISAKITGVIDFREILNMIRRKNGGGK